MTVGQLKELLVGVDDNTMVYIPVQQEFDGHLYSPCIIDSGVGEISDDPNMGEEEFETRLNLGTLKGKEAFLLLPCENEKDKNHLHELN